MVAERSDADDRMSYSPLFQLGDDETRYRALRIAGVRSEKIGDNDFLMIGADALCALTEQAFADMSHLFRPAHLQGLKDILDDEAASENDRAVALELLKNAVIASGREFPSCQDTGTAIVTGEKGQFVLFDGDMNRAISNGVAATWERRNLRFSQMAPLSTFEEVNTGTNLPSVATPNGQAAFLFLLTSALAPVIRLSYLRMVIMALPYTLTLTVSGLLSVLYLL